MILLTLIFDYSHCRTRFIPTDGAVLAVLLWVSLGGPARHDGTLEFCQNNTICREESDSTRAIVLGIWTLGEIRFRKNCGMALVGDRKGRQYRHLTTFMILILDNEKCNIIGSYESIG